MKKNLLLNIFHDCIIALKQKIIRAKKKKVVEQNGNPKPLTLYVGYRWNGTLKSHDNYETNEEDTVDLYCQRETGAFFPEQITIG